MRKAKPTKRTPSLRNNWPQIKALISPRIGIFILSLGLMAINRSASLVLPFTSKTLFDTVLSPLHPRPELLPRVIALVFAATVIQAISSYWMQLLLSRTGQQLIAEVRCKVQSHVEKLSLTYYDKNRAGVLVSRIMNDVEGLRNLVGVGLVEFGSGAVTAIVIFLFLLYRGTIVTLTIFSMVGIFSLLLQYGFKMLRPIIYDQTIIRAEVSGRLTESLGAVRVVKGYNAEERESKVFSAGVNRMLTSVMRSLKMTSTLSGASTAVVGTVFGLLMWMGGHKVLGRTWSIGDYFQYNIFLAQMIAPIYLLVNVGTQLNEAFVGLDRTRELMSEPEENESPCRTVRMPPIKGAVRFENVTFSYVEGKSVLHGISLYAHPGMLTALVGPSGSGKSTIINLLCGFHTPTSGHVLVDGNDMETVDLNTYRSQLGVVFQDSFLFDGTIRDNILFSNPGASEEQFLYACNTARVDEFAERLPEGYRTIVGERGVKLSGGQKQRLSIARALLVDPRILILDEATSSLDSDSEAMIQTGLNKLMEGRTTFVIAHRLSTIRRADQILVVDDGRIIEQGTHSALLDLHGRYYGLYTRQYGLEQNLFLAPGEGDLVEV